MSPRRLAAVLAAAAVALACGRGDRPRATPTPGEALGPKAPCTEVLDKMDAKPQVCVPEGTPPKELKIEDIVTGTGDEAKPGSIVTAHYVGVSWSTGKQFDASWDRGSEPITFPLENVIAGWKEGIPGMKVGGRRKLTIPPGKAYGPQPPPGSGIKRGETLVFVVDLVMVEGDQP